MKVHTKIGSSTYYTLGCRVIFPKFLPLRLCTVTTPYPVCFNWLKTGFWWCQGFFGGTKTLKLPSYQSWPSKLQSAYISKDTYISIDNHTHFQHNGLPCWSIDGWFHFGDLSLLYSAHSSTVWMLGMDVGYACPSMPSQKKLGSRDICLWLKMEPLRAK